MFWQGEEGRLDLLLERRLYSLKIPSMGGRSKKGAGILEKAGRSSLRRGATQQRYEDPSERYDSCRNEG